MIINYIRNFFEGMKNWVLDKLAISDFYDYEMKVLVPKHATNPIYCLGGLTFVAFIIQVITGIYLSFYYVPSVDHAYLSIQYINTGVPYGRIIRNIHRYSADAMVILVMLHMIRVYMTGGYKKPRELNWMVGVGLLMATLGVGFMGYLLPWDQKAYWAVTIGANLTENIPFIGPWIAEVLRGSAQVGQATLSRFYILHVLALPALIGVLLLLHFWLVRKHGISGPY